MARSFTSYRISLLLVLAFWVNFSLFVVHCLMLGGDPILGKVMDGHFYVRHAGKFVEVTEQQFNMGKLHGNIFLAGFACAALASLLMVLGPSSVTRLEPTDNHEYWRFGSIALFAAAVLLQFVGPRWLTFLAYAGFWLTLSGWGLEWFIREWKSETMDGDADPA